MYRIGGRQRSWAARSGGATGGIPPLKSGVLTCGRDPAGGQCQVGSLTGAVASQRVTEAPKGSLSVVGNTREECKGRRELDCETDISSRYESQGLVIRRHRVEGPSLNG